MAEKVAGPAALSDAEGKMNLGLREVGGALLVISQFTLYGDAEKGRRPSFIDAARPETAYRCTSDFSRPSGPGSSTSPPAGSAPTCWWRSTTMVR